MTYATPHPPPSDCTFDAAEARYTKLFLDVVPHCNPNYISFVPCPPLSYILKLRTPTGDGFCLGTVLQQRVSEINPFYPAAFLPVTREIVRLLLAVSLSTRHGHISQLPLEIMALCCKELYSDAQRLLEICGQESPTTEAPAGPPPDWIRGVFSKPFIGGPKTLQRVARGLAAGRRPTG